MSIETLFLAKVEEKIAEYATVGLENPPDKSEFGFGKLCGTVTGLRLAEQLFLELLRDERNDEN